jgi:hypothetical protein
MNYNLTQQYQLNIPLVQLLTENIQEVILLPGKFNVTYCHSVYITVAGSYSHAMHDNIKIFFSMIFP